MQSFNKIIMKVALCASPFLSCAIWRDKSSKRSSGLSAAAFACLPDVRLPAGVGTCDEAVQTASHRRSDLPVKSNLLITASILASNLAISWPISWSTTALTSAWPTQTHTKGGSCAGKCKQGTQQIASAVSSISSDIVYGQMGTPRNAHSKK